MVLPAPFGPSRAKIVPCGTVRSMPSSTVFSPKDLRRRRAEIAATAVVAPVVDITVFTPLRPGGARGGW